MGRAELTEIEQAFPYRELGILDESGVLSLLRQPETLLTEGMCRLKLAPHQVKTMQAP